MRCKGKFINDRTCDLCKISCAQEYFDCTAEYQSKVDAERRLKDIAATCGYKTRCYDEYTPFDGCSKNGNGYGRNADECRPSEKCLGNTQTS